MSRTACGPVKGSLALAAMVVACLELAVVARPDTPQPALSPVVVEVDLDDQVQPISAEFVKRGIRHANDTNAAAVLLVMNTPGGLESSMREIIQAILDSRVPVIAYVSPSGGRAASAGFFILLSADVAVMAPGTNTGAAHPVLIGGYGIGQVMESKIENDSAAFIRSLADRRGRNTKLAEEGVRQSRSFTEKEALDDKLIDAVARTPGEIFSSFDGRSVKRFDGSSQTLHLAGAQLLPYQMTAREKFLYYVVDPNMAFLLAVVGVVLLYVEFTHPGLVAPGVVGAIAVVLALYAFHLLPIRVAGVLLILIGLVLFALEVKVTSHGVLAAGGVAAMVIGSLILIDSPWPVARIRLSTSLGVTLPAAVIVAILLRFALAARRQKSVTGAEGLVDSIGVARTDLELEGKVVVHGELWEARATQKVPKGARVRVREVQGLTLLVEPVSESR